MTTHAIGLDRSLCLRAEPSTDLDLAQGALRNLAAGDHDALGELYDLFADELYGLALWICGNADDAADVIQTLFVRVLQRRHRMGNIHHPRAYLMKMVRSISSDLRQGRHRLERFDTTLLQPVVPDVERRLEADRATSLVARLPAKQRAVIYLRFFAELTFGDIGRVMGISTFTAASRHRLAMRKLRRWMGDRNE